MNPLIRKILYIGLLCLIILLQIYFQNSQQPGPSSPNPQAPIANTENLRITAKSQSSPDESTGYSPKAQSTTKHLPREVQETLALIKQRGPFPYEHDGIVFNNYENQLPPKKRGYYHEYTVRTPGASNRGARRIITGQNGEYYYTSDHYNTFTRLELK